MYLKMMIIKRTLLTGLLLTGLLAGMVSASSSGLALSPYGAGQPQCHCPRVPGVPLEVTGVSWHVDSTDYRYVDQAILELQATDRKSHRVELYLTLTGPAGDVLYRGGATWRVPPQGITAIYHLDGVAAADVTGLSLTAITDNGRRR